MNNILNGKLVRLQSNKDNGRVHSNAVFLLLVLNGDISIYENVYNDQKHGIKLSDCQTLCQHRVRCDANSSCGVMPALCAV